MTSMPAPAKSCRTWSGVQWNEGARLRHPNREETKMSRILPIKWTRISIAVFLTGAFFAAGAQGPHPLSIPLVCGHGDCPLLKGAPQTSGMRSGYVRLQPGETVGWHTTGTNEETLVILRGQGTALIEGQESRPFVAPALVYIPPATRHNVQNTGQEKLEYVYVVAPAKRP